MCNPTYIEIVREIPLDNKKTLLNTTKNELELIREEIVKYCNEPRSVREIKEHIKFDTTLDSVRRYIVNPLMRDGKLKYTHTYSGHFNQRYIDARIEVTQQMRDEIKAKADTLTPERIDKILAYCKKPRGIKEIEKHINTTNAREYTKQLIEQGKLKYTFPDIPSYCKQRYFNASEQCEQFTDDAVAEYCKEPRTKFEIEKHFDITKAMRKGVIERLLESGKICYTKESEKHGKFDGNRRLVKNG